ncbi:MAG: lysophospholipid acyltransferase family protein [Candidatus Cloacimonetes bacterium]|nr:lysophospholipid acyltransferase family protein [Candidatus Cloacimonadota bacterium]
MREKRIKSIIEYLLFIIILQLFKLLPYKASQMLIVWIFLFSGLIVGIRKRVVQEQLQISFPEKEETEIKVLTRQIYKNLAFTSLEMFAKQKLDNIEVEGWDNILNALKLKRGLIIVTGHIGNWELAGRYIAHQKLTINVVIKRLRNRYFNDYVNRTRERDGIKIIYKTKTMRTVLTALKNNEIVVLLIDQDAGKEGVILPFLNREASVFTGFARLAERYDTPMITGIALRDSDDKNRFVFEQHLLPSEFNQEEDKIMKITAYFHARLEDYIMKHPEQWFWVHRRWKGAKKAKKLYQ